MMLDKNQIRVISSFEFKMGCKAVETTQNINKAFGPGTANECTVQWWFKKFCKGDESLDNEEHTGWPLEVDDDLLKAIIKAESLKTTQEVAQELNINHFTVIQHLKQIGKVKKLDKWVPHDLTTNQKSFHFEVSSSLIVHNSFSIRLWCTMKKWIIYDTRWWPAQWLDQEEAPKHFPKPNLHQKGSWSLFGGQLPIWSTRSFWISAKPLHLRSLLSKPMRCIKNCNTFSQQERAQFLSMTMPDHTSYNQHFKRWMNRAMKFCLIHHIHVTSHQLTTISSSILTTFRQGKHFHNQQEAEHAFQEFTEFWSMDSYVTGVNKLISGWKKICWL